jgi:hypothetical protein
MSANSDSLISSIKGAGNDEGLRPKDVAALLTEFLSLIEYRLIAKQEKFIRNDVKINSNKTFWSNSINFYDEKKVILKSFYLSEWLPASPGRYFTTEATILEWY